MADDLPVLTFGSAEELQRWLEAHHATADGFWLRIAKKGSGATTVSASDALDIALCFGWIDGLRNTLDETHWLLRFSPRRARSTWSKVNCERVEALVQRGVMRPAGLREVERARADGRWEEAYLRQDGPVPDDLARALAQNEAAGSFFASLPRTDRTAILNHLRDAKRQQTRDRRIAQCVALLAEGRTLRTAR
jgi:uncharacterized protein YdeI (YjbR/CyaY-like superfamily)